MKNIFFLLTFTLSLLFTCTYTVGGVITKTAEIGIPDDLYLSDYILGPGDKLEIKVYRNDELEFTQQIDSSGKISYPLLGDLIVAGMTPYALRESIAKGLSKFLHDPQVMINLTAYQSNKITVIGNVKNTGVLSIDHQPKILEIISHSGGFNSNADRTNVLVIRKTENGSSILKLNLKKALEGDNSQNVLLIKNDIVYVPSDTNKLIVLGEVAAPGSVDLDKDFNDTMSLLEVITKVGGFSVNADKSGVVLIRKEGEQLELKKLNIKNALENGDLSQNIKVQKGDIVFIPKIEQRIIVIGEVTSPGSVPFDKPLNIMELLSKAGGFTQNANKNNVVVVRYDRDQPRFITIDIENALNVGDPNQNLLLQNGDIVYIPRDNKRVIVLGEVVTPAQHTFLAPMNIVDAISKSGGLLRTANEEKIIIVRQGAVKQINLNNIYQKGDIEQNIILQNGDIVYVPTTMIADVETVLRHITNIFSTITTVASPVILWPPFRDALTGKSDTAISVPVGPAAGSSN